MLPPICDCSDAPGSGANISPLSRASELDVPGLHARLDVHPPEQRVELTHAGQPVEREDDPAVDRHAAPGGTGAATARRDRDVVFVAPGDNLRDLLGRLREDHSLRRGRQPGQVGRVPADLGQHRLLAHDGAQLSFHGIESRA